MVMMKTDKARQVLQNRANLSVQERQVLILCDGRRSRQEIASWLGDSVLALIEGLAQQGLLAEREATPWAPAAFAATRVAASRTSRDQAIAQAAWRSAPASPLAVQTSPAPLEGDGDTIFAPLADDTDAPPARAHVAQGAVAKRSLAACKMYALGILQMQRGGEAQAMITQLNRSSDEEQLLTGLTDLLTFLQLKTHASYAERVKNHVITILPEQHVAALRHRLPLVV